jgi:hypothetical protein
MLSDWQTDMLKAYTQQNRIQNGAKEEQNRHEETNPAMMDNYFKKLMRLSDKLDQDTTIDVEHKESYNRMAKIVEKNQAPLPDSLLGPKKPKSKPKAPKNMGLVDTLTFINEFPQEHSSSHRMDWYNDIIATPTPPISHTLEGHLAKLKKEELACDDFQPLTLGDLEQLKTHAGAPQTPN